MKKRVIVLMLCIAVMLGFGASAQAAGDGIDVYIDGEALEFDVAPTVINDRTMVPVRRIFEALGAAISWDEGEQLVTAVKGDTTVLLTIGSSYMEVRAGGTSESHYLDSPAVILDSRALIPLRAVSSALDAAVVWHAGGRDIHIYGARELAMDGALYESWDPAHIRTSYGGVEYTDLSIEGGELTVRFLTNDERLLRLWLSVGGEEEFVDVTPGEEQSASLSLERAFTSGEEEFTIYIKDDPASNSYTSYIWDEIFIRCEDGEYSFVESPVLRYNLERAYVAYDITDCFVGSISGEIKELSDSICEGAADDYERLLRIHDWVADNIYYNYDYLLGNSDSIAYDADDVLRDRASVCEGYARLTRELINAQGIPCVQLAGYALGVGSSGVWDESSAGTESSNHAWNRAYAGGRWINIDTTWSSDNQLMDGELIYGGVRTHKYFDTSEVYFSFTHKHTGYPTA